MKKLIGMVEFINHITTKPLGGQQVASVRHVELEKYRMIFKHSQFLQQTPTIGMFVPCDEDGNVLEKPIWLSRYLAGGSPFMNIDEILTCQQYQKAEQKVIFDGFVYNGGSNDRNIHFIKKENIDITFSNNKCELFNNEINTIEDLVSYNLILK